MYIALHYLLRRSVHSVLRTLLLLTYSNAHTTDAHIPTTLTVFLPIHLLPLHPTPAAPYPRPTSPHPKAAPQDTHTPHPASCYNTGPPTQTYLPDHRISFSFPTRLTQRKEQSSHTFGPARQVLGDSNPLRELAPCGARNLDVRA